MPSPREIADERLARGEISQKEHATIIRRLASPTLLDPDLMPPLPASGQPTHSAVPPPLPSGQPVTYASAGHSSGFAKPTRSGGTPVWPWIVGVAAVVVAGFFYLVFMTVEGLQIGNLQATGTTIKFKLANNSDNTGDVVIWIEQNDLTMCERVARVEPNHTYNFTIGCPTLQNGKFELMRQWAEFNADRALVAERVNVN